MICYIAGKFEAGNSLNLAVNSGRRSTLVDNGTLLPSDVIDFADVARSEILAGNSFIVRCHVSSK